MTDRIPASQIPEAPKTTGPGAWLRGLLPRFDRLLSLDHSAARKASEEYDEAYHDAVHALKDLRHFAAIIAPTRPASPAETTPFEELVDRLTILVSKTWLIEKGYSNLVERRQHAKDVAAARLRVIEMHSALIPSAEDAKRILAWSDAHGGFGWLDDKYQAALRRIANGETEK